MKILLRAVAALLAAGLFQPAHGNNILVTNPVVKALSSTTAAIRFELSWENSWRDEINYDAAWLFAKYSADGGATWHHATLKGSGVDPSGFSAGSWTNGEWVVPADGTGAFLQRKSAGSGLVASTNVTLVWNFASNGVLPSSQVRVKVLAVEMVYIPEGPFYAGDDSSFNPFLVSQITSSDMTRTNCGGAGTLASPCTNAAAGLGRPKGVLGVFTNGYPNGYNAFYMMKYEVSRQQMLDFINLLPYAAATNILNMMNTSDFGTRLTPIGGAWPNVTNALPEVGASYYQSQGWPVCFAYLDWAALRPMTELEYEKACRGPIKPVDQDHAWGTAYHNMTRTGGVTNQDKTGEAPIDPDVNVITVASPPRCGATARPTSDQFQSGASYYGVMDLTGGLVERCVSSGTSTRTGTPGTGTLRFDGSHGDGEVSAAGTNSVPAWGRLASADYSSRGGGSDTGWLQWRVADRNRANADNNYANTPGMRGVRTR